jgi:hypothetical protein
LSIGTFFKIHRHFRRLLIGVASTVVLYTVLGFLVVPALARSIGQSKLSEFLHRQVTIEQVRLNPYALTATIRNLRIRDRDGIRDLFAFKEVYVNLQIASVFKGGVVIRQLRVVEPAISLVRTAEDRYNFSDILDDLAAAPAAPAPPPSPDAKPARFSLSNIELVGGHIELDDRFKSTRHEIAALNISVPFVSNFPYLVDTFVQPAFSAIINGTKLAVQGRTKPFADSLESSIDVNLVKVDLPYYLAYLPVKLNMKLRSAILDTNLKVTFIQYRDRAPRVDVAGGVALSSLEVVDDKDRPLLKLPLLDIHISSSDLLSNKLVLQRVLLQELVVHVRRGRQGELQVLSLLPSAPAPAEPAATKDARDTQDSNPQPWLVELAEFKLDKARIVFSDDSNPRPFQTTIDPLTVTLHHLTTARGGQARLALAATTDAGEHLTVAGELSLEPVAFNGTLACKGVSLPRFAPYYASQILFDLRQGVLDVSVPLRMAMKGKEMELVITGLQTELRDLQLRRRGEREDFLRLPELAVRETNLDLGRREVVLGDISTSGARIRVERAGKEQPWNLEMLVPSPAPASRAATPGNTPAANTNGQPFAVTVKKLDLKGWSVRIEDRAPRLAAITNVDRIGLRIDGLGTARGQQGRVNLQARLNQIGAINVGGSFGITPLQANVQVQVKNIPIVPMQPYFQDDVGLLLTGGQIGVNGRVVLATGPKGPGVTYKGEFSIGDVVAVSRSGTDELARLGSLRISGIDAVSEPFKLSIGEIAISDYGANLVINADHTINLASIVPADSKGANKTVAPPPPAPGSTATSATPQQTEKAGAIPAVKIGAIVLRGGTIHVTDRSIHPAFGTTLSELGGRIAGLSFEETDRASVDLKGKLGNGPLEISGRINPLAKKPFIDLAFKLSDMDLSAMTPYSGKYAGYAVEKGQLYLDLKYLIEARQLNAKNDVRLAQFTFGNSVESKDSTGLPVRLAVSLLKDRHGIIQLDLPVTGSLDDPKFSVWGVVLMVLKNLLIKAATSPFALIGSLFGQGEELSSLEFEPGHADIPSGARVKVNTLGKALFERPALRLEVEGHADPARDLEALRGQELQRRVKAQKLKETVAGGVDANNNVTVSDLEYPKYLRLAYRAEEKIAKPKNALGMIKDIPVSEMERLMLGAIVVTQDDLRLLARQRAQVVREQILRAQKIETERVFLVEPKTILPQHKDKIRDSRVDFRLQ